MAAAVENWSEVEIGDAEIDEIIEESSVSFGFVRGRLLPFRLGP